MCNKYKKKCIFFYRLTAQQALNHPWIVGEGTGEGIAPVEIPQDVIKSLRRLNSKTNFQREILTTIAKYALIFLQTWS